LWQETVTGTKIVIQAEVRNFTGLLGKNKEYSCGGFLLEAQKGSSNKYCAIQAEDGYENHM
jgi:hypothetical protein